MRQNFFNKDASPAGKASQNKLGLLGSRLHEHVINNKAVGEAKIKDEASLNLGENHHYLYND